MMNDVIGKRCGRIRILIPIILLFSSSGFYDDLAEIVIAQPNDTMIGNYEVPFLNYSILRNLDEIDLTASDYNFYINSHNDSSPVIVLFPPILNHSKDTNAFTSKNIGTSTQTNDPGGALISQIALLIIGGALTSIIGPFIINKYQNRQKRIEVALLSFKQITKSHTFITNLITESILSIASIVEKYEVAVKGGINTQRKNIEKDDSDVTSATKNNIKDQPRSVDTDNINNELKKLNNAANDINDIAGKATSNLNDWIVSYSEITSDLKTLFYKNYKIYREIDRYYSALIQLNKLIYQYGMYARDFEIGNLSYTSTLIEIEKIRNSNNTSLLKISRSYGQSLIDTTRSEMMLNWFDRSIHAFIDTLKRKSKNKTSTPRSYF